MMPSAASGFERKVSARNPDDPAVSFWPEKKLVIPGVTAVMSASVMADPVPDSAVATATSALKP